jgi:hypothetical protein
MSLKRIVIVLIAAATLSPAELSAQTLFGGRLGAYVEQEALFLGGEVLTPLGNAFYLNPNVEYVFANRANQATFNFDVHYDFARRGTLTFWVGAGLGILYFDPDGAAGSETNVGANLLFGTAFLRTADVIPYVQAKVIVADDSEFVIGFGVRF